VAFVEVKTRTDGRCGDPLEAVTARKRSEVERVARAWLRARGPDVGERLELRFDAVGVLLSPGCPPMLRHVEDAWRAGNSG
jgi:Holliday junction resolvase-like predicted endonuclease